MLSAFDPSSLSLPRPALNAVEKNIKYRLSGRDQVVSLAAENPICSHLIQRAEQNLCRNFCVDPRAKHTFALAVFDDRAYQFEILGYLRSRELFHEFCR